jgi:hypothetical protein
MVCPIRGLVFLGANGGRPLAFRSRFVSMAYQCRAGVLGNGTPLALDMAAAAMRERKRRTKLEKARAEWVKPPGDGSAADIAAAAGISVHSLHKHRGPCAEARRKKGSGRKVHA